MGQHMMLAFTCMCNNVTRVTIWRWLIGYHADMVPCEPNSCMTSFGL